MVKQLEVRNLLLARKVMLNENKSVVDDGAPVESKAGMVGFNRTRSFPCVCLH